MKKVAFAIVLLTFAIALAACETTQKAEAPVAKTDNGTLTLDQIAETLPGFGVLMQEIGVRTTTAFFAAEAGNWDLVDYEIKEISEAFEVGMITRPKRKQAAETFLNGSFAKLKTAAESREIDEFKTAFDDTVAACNGCHASDDKAYIKYKVPETSIEPLDLRAKE